MLLRCTASTVIEIGNMRMPEIKLAWGKYIVMFKSLLVHLTMSVKDGNVFIHAQL